MKLKITAAILQEMSPAIEDARGGKYPQDADSMYFKVDDAFNAASAKARSVLVTPSTANSTTSGAPSVTDSMRYPRSSLPARVTSFSSTKARSAPFRYPGSYRYRPLGPTTTSLHSARSGSAG